VNNTRSNGVEKPLFLITFCAALALAGCNGTTLNPSSKTEPNEQLQPSFSDFSDLPIPTSAHMNVDRSLILGPKDSWLGRLVFHSSNSASESFDFYTNGMPRFNWQPVAVVRGATSSMTYTRSDRVAAIQITGTTFGGSDIEITVAPAANGGSYSGGGSSYSGGSSPSRGGGISSTPLAP
jgi:hypothetical protein